MTKLEQQRKQKTYNPAEGKFIFSTSDLNLYATVLDEFETRHKTLSDKIDHTYRIGNLMKDYLEKQIILDYKLRGETAQLETEHPELAEFAKKYLGLEMYSDLTMQANGKPLAIDSTGYKQILKMTDELNSKFHLDMQLLEK